MLRRQGICIVAVFAMIVGLAGPVSVAQAAGPVAPRLAAQEGLDAVWSRVRDWIEAALPWSVVTAADCDRGAMADPNGHCASVAAPSCDRGAMVDPDGHCASVAAPPGDHGPGIDLDGG